MRVLGFTKKWDKLGKPTFTTFRFTRRDRDWQVGELVQVVIKPRTPGREVLGPAEIISSKPRWIYEIRVEEAWEDGFPTYRDMHDWLLKTHGQRCWEEPINKLTLRWIK